MRLSAYVFASMELAHEYAKMGRLQTAGSLYHLLFSNSKDVHASDHIRVIAMLRHAETLALVGNVAQA
jgi:hypothetical protein